MIICQLLLATTIVLISPIGCVEENEVHTSFPNHANGMTFVSTIDGYLRAIDPETGFTKWELKEEPILKAPTSIQKRLTFLPDPRDGSLYMLVEGHFKKLSYSIPDLVNFSPCRSSDGVLYTGNKKDVWLEINMKTGVKERELSHSSDSSQCPISTSKTTYIGRTVYELTMFDIENHQRKWNATFADYSSHLLAADVSYPYQHFASSSDGHLLTVDASTGTVLWDQNLGSAIVAMYLLQNDGLHKLPYTVLGKETMEELTKLLLSASSFKITRIFLRDVSFPLCVLFYFLAFSSTLLGSISIRSSSSFSLLSGSSPSSLKEIPSLIPLRRTKYPCSGHNALMYCKRPCSIFEGNDRRFSQFCN